MRKKNPVTIEGRKATFLVHLGWLHKICGQAFPLHGFFITFATMLLSVVIPFYQSATTLRQSVASVLAQQVDEMEIILVDDGAPADARQIASDIVAGHENVRCVSQDNQGLSCARNVGVAVAKGQYITFVDSDDTVAPGTYAAALAMLKRHPEIALLEFPVLVGEGSAQAHQLAFAPRLYTDWRHYWLRTRAYIHGYAWNKIYRREQVMRHPFKMGAAFEDIEFLMRLLPSCPCIATMNEGCYHYRQNPHGLSAKASSFQLESLLHWHVNTMKKVCDKAYFACILNVQLDVYRQGGPILLPHRPPFRGTFKLYIYSLIGIQRLCFIHKIYKALLQNRW